MKCPRCRTVDHVKIPRLRWMRWIPGTGHYRCERCGAEFVAFFGWLPCRRGFVLMSVGFIFVCIVEYLILGRDGFQSLMSDLMSHFMRAGP